MKDDILIMQFLSFSLFLILVGEAIFTGDKSRHIQDDLTYIRSSLNITVLHMIKVEDDVNSMKEEVSNIRKLNYGYFKNNEKIKNNRNKPKI